MAVSLVIQRTKALQSGQTLGDKEKILSSNKVTGVSLNVPIWGTCRPTKVCAETCYAARNVPIALPNSLNKQLRTYNSIKGDPHGVAGRIVAEMIRHMRHGAKFLRWNGVGDLFDESIVCLQSVAEALPNLPIWVVTRIPEMAARVPDLPNVFVHFSLDRASVERYHKLCALKPLSSRIFFSYQEDAGEQSLPYDLGLVPVSVYFTNLYAKPAPQVFQSVSCPLNSLADTTNACESCGRCWDGTAQGMAVVATKAEGGVADSWRTVQPALGEREPLL